MSKQKQLIEILDILAVNDNHHVRAGVVEAASVLGRKDLLEKLANDENFFVRAEVAKQGYALKKLINDNDYRVRVEVARQKYKLDILIDDLNSYVREAVAYQGHGLNKLVNDKDKYVRAAVAEAAGRLGRKKVLKKLLNDNFSLVRLYAKQGLKK